MTLPHVVPSPGFRLPPPPPQAASLRTDALDEVRAFVARADGEHSRVAHGAGPLGFEWHAVSGPAVAVRWGRAGLAQTIRGGVGSAVVHLSIDCANTYAFGRRRVRVAPGEAAFIAPGGEFTRRSEPGAVVAIGLDRARLAAEVEARWPGIAGRWTPQSQAVPLDAPARAAVERAFGAVVTAFGDGELAPRQRDHAEAAAISAVAGLLMRDGDVAGAAPLAVARVALLEDWIDAHLGEPITMGRLCAVAGVGARTLQAAFAMQRGVSPMRFVAERRLAAARRELLRAEPAQDVTSIAFDVGFSHLGRFAALYREAYGESPSRTLRGRPP